jgi:diguanylate cyclase (GGDEF)-like protein/PAS domain S-box-containing protein
MVAELVLTIILAIGVVAGVGYGLRRNAFGKRLARNNEYQRLLAQASQLIRVDAHENVLFQDLCSLICQMDPVRLAWIGRPGPNGQVVALASCGDTGYLDKIDVSILENLPAGQGPVGRAWRMGRAIFDAEALHNPSYEPWRRAASQHNLMGVHALPIMEHTSIDAILVVYFAKHALPGVEEQLLLERLANDLSNGLTVIRDQQQRRQLAAAIAQVPEAVFMLDQAGLISWCNEGCERLFELEAGTCVGADPGVVFGDRHFDGLLTRLGRTSQGDDALEWDAPQVSQAGVHHWVHVSATRLLGNHEEVIGAVVVEVDLTDERAAIDAQQRLLAILDYTSDGIGITDRNGRLIYLNNGGRQLLNLAPEAHVEGKHFFELIGDPAGQDSFLISVQQAASNGRWQGELSITRTDGTTIPLSMVMMAHRNGSGHVEYLSAIARNIVDLKEREQELSYLAEHDALTGLPNRRALDKLLTSALAQAKVNQRTLAIGVIDLDDFKPVNDRFGHHSGDELLVQLARRLMGLLREGDSIIRLAGDEFVVLINALATTPSQPSHDLTHTLTRLHQAVEMPFALDANTSVTIDMSIGVALFPHDALEPDALLRAADAALYHAKQDKHDRQRWWTLLSESMEPSVANPPKPSPPSAYGDQAAGLLASALTDCDNLVDHAIGAYYDIIDRFGASQRILASLGADGHTALKAQQAKYLAAILTPTLEQSTLERMAAHVGVAHWLVGLSPANLVDSTNTFRQALIDGLDGVRTQAHNAKQLMALIDRRIDDELTAQLAAISAVNDRYFNIFANPLPADAATWIDVIQAEVDIIGDLPGVRAVVLARQASNDALIVEAYAGSKGHAIADAFNAPEASNPVYPSNTSNQGLPARAWREATIVAADRLVGDDINVGNDAVVGIFGLTSAVAIPIQNLDGRPVGLVMLVGTHPAQFSSDWMKRFCVNLKQRFENLFYRIVTPTQVLARGQAIAYRELLLSGGLRMYVQPIIELGTGKVVKVEGLARLADHDGTIIGPGSFLGILGTSERYQLFRLGLIQLLDAERHWRSHGLILDITVNIDASTLANPELTPWLSETLREHRFPPQRLILELLETDQHPVTDPRTLAAVTQTGIQLAIDDMGSGYSNWLRLIDIPAKLIKIDHHFVARIKDHPRTALNLLGTLILSAVDAGQQVVVEGIEDATLAEVAKRLGATFGQGFHIARPMPTDQLVPWALSYRSGVDDELQSLLGAMAYHWAFVHSPRHYRRGPLTECALTRYFERTGYSDSVGAMLHNDLHAHDIPPTEVVDALTDWFEEVTTQVLAQAPLENPTAFDGASLDPLQSGRQDRTRMPASAQDDHDTPWSWTI